MGTPTAISLSLVLATAFATLACDGRRQPEAGGELASAPESESPVGYAPPASWILGPLYGTVCPLGTECVAFPGATMRDEVSFILDNLERYDIPITGFHFDGNLWSGGSCDWALGPEVIDRLRSAGRKALLHFWGNCRTGADLDRVHSQLGDVLGGLYLDEGADDGLAKLVTDWMQSRLPRIGEVVMKDFAFDGLQTKAGLSAYGHTAYVNDLTSDMAGLRTGIERVFAAAEVLPAPFNEFTAYDPTGGRAEEEVYFRRLHFGAMQVVMDHSPYVSADPWGPSYSPALLEAFRYYSWLHHELIPYLHSYDFAAFEGGAPIFRERDLVHTATMIGDEIFVRYVTELGAREVDVPLPAGEWVDYWDESRLLHGPATLRQAAPLGREPIFVRSGAIIPMRVARAYTSHGTPESAGSLTLLVYPGGRGRFRYHDELRRRWFPFEASTEAEQLELRSAADFPDPVLYRVSRWPRAPRSVARRHATVVVDGASAPGFEPLPEREGEPQVNGSMESAWFYDTASQRLIIKVVPGR